MPAVQVFIMIHGMNPALGPSSPFQVYETFWQDLVKANPALKEAVHRRIGVEWGHELSKGPDPFAAAWTDAASAAETLRGDQKLTRAQEIVSGLTSYLRIQETPDSNNHVRRGWNMDWSFVPFLRGIVMNLRTELVLRGMGDVVYYCSAEGERRVRRAVYDQILSRLEDYSAEKAVRLHLAGHSLGVTVAHDFLYGLFAPGHEPDFLKEEQGDAAALERYRKWRAKAQAGELSLGSFSASASQIPLFIFRKQSLIDLLTQGRKLDSSALGVREQTKIQWKFFYDVDDLLGFACRSLYEPAGAIMDYQVDTGDMPEDAHTGYWREEEVVRETAALILDNL